jgi:hypothetical protein
MDISGTLNHWTHRFSSCSPASAGIASVPAPSAVSASSLLSTFFVLSPVTHYLADGVASIVFRSGFFYDLSRYLRRRSSRVTADAVVLEFNQRIFDAPVGWSGFFNPDRFLEVLVRTVPGTQRRR